MIKILSNFILYPQGSSHISFQPIDSIKTQKSENKSIFINDIPQIILPD
jgi:hypothetical protein